MKLLTSILEKTQFHGHARGINDDDAFKKSFICDFYEKDVLKTSLK